MILVTGGAGFIGQRLIRRLLDEGREIRTLIRPSVRTPKLPQGVPVEAAISSLADTRGLRAALVGVDTVFHLAGVTWSDPVTNVRVTEAEGTRNLLQTAEDAGVNRLVYLSHLDADRASAFPLLKARGIAEEFIRQSPIPFTILRSAIVFGPGDHFTTAMAKLMAYLPRFFPMPSDGEMLLQPIWVEDLVTCLAWCLDEEETFGQTIEIGGPEHLTFRHIAELVKAKAGLDRQLLPFRPSYLRILRSITRVFAPHLPVSTLWLDYLAADRICGLDTMARVFHLMPARFSQKIEYLTGVDWKAAMQDKMGKRKTSSQTP